MDRRQVIALRKVAGPDEPFDENKLRASLLRAGADDALIESIVREVFDEVKTGDSTDKVRDLAMHALQKRTQRVAARYNLKRAIVALGPTGYPFERLWGAVLRAAGFETTFDVTVQGRCIHHEIDVVGVHPSERRLAECKFHHDASRRTDLKVALYCQARSLDLQQRKPAPDLQEAFELVTNTRFTNDAVTYAACTGLRLVSWDYPDGGSLRELVDAHALYPITCLSTLKKRHQRALFDQDVVTCRGLVDEPTALTSLDLRRSEAEAVMDEAAELVSVADVNRRATKELSRPK